MENDQLVCFHLLWLVLPQRAYLRYGDILCKCLNIAKCTTVCAGYINALVLVCQFYKVYLKLKYSLIDLRYFGGEQESIKEMVVFVFLFHHLLEQFLYVSCKIKRTGQKMAENMREFEIKRGGHHSTFLFILWKYLHTVCETYLHTVCENYQYMCSLRLERLFKSCPILCCTNCYFIFCLSSL